MCCLDTESVSALATYWVLPRLHSCNIDYLKVDYSPAGSCPGDILILTCPPPVYSILDRY